MRRRGVVLALLWTLLLSTTGVAAIRHVKPAASGTGDCSSAANACQVSEALVGLACGDIVRLNGSLAAGTGLYVGANSMLAVRAGTGVGCGANPVVIDAVIPNGPMVDGQDPTPPYARRNPLVLSGVSNITVRDIRLRNGNFNLVVLGALDTTTTNITLQRLRGYDVRGSDTTGFGISVINASNLLIEDSIMIGRFRKAVQVYKTPHNANVVFVRNIFIRHFDYTINHGNVITTGYCAKGPIRFLNTIVAEDSLPGSAIENGGAHLSTDHWNDPTHNAHCGTLTFPETIQIEYKGNIAYHVDGQVLTGTGRRLFALNANSGNLQPGTTVNVVSDHNLAIRRVAASPETAFTIFPLDTNPNDGDGANLYTTNHWTDDVGTLAANKTTEEGAATLASLGGDVLQYTGSCTAPAARGAQIKCRYNTDGTLSTTPLWPWPYAAEIKAFLAESPYSNLGLNHVGQKDINIFMQGLTGANFAPIANPTLHLDFAVAGTPGTQPTATPVGTAIPAFTVCVLDADNQVSGSFTNPFTLALASGTGALSGTLTGVPDDGCVTFSNVVPTTIGAKTLTATATGSTSGTSASFLVSEAPIDIPVTPSTVQYRVQ